MSDDFNLTDVEIYELLLELDAMSQSSYIAACALSQLELYIGNILEKAACVAEHSHSTCSASISPFL